MGSAIYLIQDGTQLVEMTEQPYESEDLLQKLLASYPNLLAGEQIDSTAPRRWLLVSREMEVPFEEDGCDRWSLDHLFLDQDGIPTFVEVKRSTNTQIRREVVGQMLDYAANGVVYWSIEKIRAQFEANCQVKGQDSEQILGEFLGAEVDTTEFWENVKTNLLAGKVRLVFVADKIPTELQRVVEFLNGQMNPAQVLAVELKQYVGQGLRTLVPKVIGHTAEAQGKKSVSTGEMKQWDESSFFKKLEERQKPEQLEVARQIHEWVKTHLKIRWSKGKIGAFYAIAEHKNTELQPLSVWAGTGVNNLEAMVQISFAVLKQKPPFDDEAKRVELLHRLNNISGVAFSPSAINGYPYIHLYKLQEEIVLKQFLELSDWMVREFKAL